MKLPHSSEYFFNHRIGIQKALAEWGGVENIRLTCPRASELEVPGSGVLLNVRPKCGEGDCGN